MSREYWTLGEKEKEIDTRNRDRKGEVRCEASRWN